MVLFLIQIFSTLLKYYHILVFKFFPMYSNGTFFVAEFWDFSKMVPFLFVIFWYFFLMVPFFVAEFSHISQLVPYLLQNFRTCLKWYHFCFIFFAFCSNR